MEHLARILETHPHPASKAGDSALACIEACAECAQVCATCADACLAEDEVGDLVQCIRLLLDCSDICDATGRLIARAGRRDERTLEAMLEACARVCRACAAECSHHAETMRHCQVCADTCGRCAVACEAMSSALVP